MMNLALLADFQTTGVITFVEYYLAMMSVMMLSFTLCCKMHNGAHLHIYAQLFSCQ